nr:hypothetical protein [Escherichia coli]
MSKKGSYHNCSYYGDNRCDYDMRDRQQRLLLSYVHEQEPYILPYSCFPLDNLKDNCCAIKTR